jgi:TonB-linked SusC/RagA family outer membrane protein
LAGRLPGLTAVTTSGEPGYDGTTLRIRGSNTFNDNSVLVVIDGVPDRSLERLDPYSIESVTILKDASAAIYGSRAANGVILVTTKRGKLGKPEITFNANYGYNQPTKLPKMADAATYATMLNEIAYYNNPSVGMNSVYTADQIQKYRDGSDPLRYPNTDWFSKVIKPRSAQHNQSLTISGGTDAMRYFVSLGAKHQDGNYHNSATFYNQYEFRSNIDGKISKNISIGVDLAGRQEDRNFPIRGADDIFRGLIQSYPNSVAIWPNGEPGPAIESGRNPVATSTDVAGTTRDKNYVLNSNLKLDITIPWVKGLSFSGNLSYDQGFKFIKSFSKPFNLYTWDGTTIDATGNPVLISKAYGGGTNNTPSLSESFTSNYNKLAYGLINYQPKISGNHDLKLMVGSQYSKGNSESFNAYRDYFLSSAIQQIFAGATTYQRTGGTGSVNARLSYFGRANYSYANKYLVEFVGRYDGSYIFPENKRFGFFPGVSLGWVASNEKFWKDNISFIDYFKLRTSWGQTGNDRVPEFQYLTAYLFGYQADQNFNYPFVVYSGSALTELKTVYERVLANPNITWEVSNQTNIGFNAEFLNNRLSIEGDYFHYKRSNILWPPNATVPASAGLSLPDINYGKASNKGFDFAITYRDAAKSKLGYSVSVNAGYAKNKVIEWGETPGVPEWQKTTGHPMGSGLYYLADGIYHSKSDIPSNLTYAIGSTPDAGDIRFVDYNDDGKIDANDQVRIYKNNIPRLTFGSNINVNYKGFDLAILVQGATGAVSYVTNDGGQFGNYFQSFADARWTPDNPTANGPRTYNRGNWYWGAGNTYFLHKNDYVRLKTAQLGYTVHSKGIQNAGIRNLRVYVSGYNLLTYSPEMKEFDPELGANTNAREGAAYVSGNTYPLQRVVSVGLTVGF